jgi:hypothetical protein
MTGALPTICVFAGVKRRTGGGAALGRGRPIRQIGTIW